MTMIPLTRSIQILWKPTISAQANLRSRLSEAAVAKNPHLKRSRFDSTRLVAAMLDLLSRLSEAAAAKNSQLERSDPAHGDMSESLWRRCA